MTIPRVLLFAALLVLGFMIWGIHQDVFTLTQEARGLKDVIIRQPTPSGISGETSQPTRAVPLPRLRPKRRFHRPTPPASVNTSARHGGFGQTSRRKPIIHKPMHRLGVIHPKRESPVRPSPGYGLTSRLIAPIQGDSADDTVVFKLPVPLTDSIPR